MKFKIFDGAKGNGTFDGIARMEKEINWWLEREKVKVLQQNIVATENGSSTKIYVSFLYEE